MQFCHFESWQYDVRRRKIIWAVQLVKHPMLHASKLQIRASEEFIVRACQIAVKKFAARQHQEIFVGFGGCTSKYNHVSGMSPWSMETSQECWMFFLNFFFFQHFSICFIMKSCWNDRRTEGLKFRTRRVPKTSSTSRKARSFSEMPFFSTAWADHRAVMSKVDLKFDAGKLHFKFLGQMEFF